MVRTVHDGLKFTVGGTDIGLTKEAVERKLNGLEPETVREVYVEVDGRRYPIKQALAMATGLPKGGFTTHDAMRVLRKLSFPIGTASSAGPATTATSSIAKPPILVEVNLTGWLQQLMNDLDGALADFAHILNAIENGTYSTGVSGQRFGLVEVGFENVTELVSTARQRAANSCFMTAIGKFISFLDKLIASANVHREGIPVDRNLSGGEEITKYINEYMTHRTNAVARDRGLTNPKKLSYFDIPETSRQTALGYFALRRALEHHHQIASEEINLRFLKQKFFIDNAEITRLPAYISGGQTLQLRLVPEVKSYPMGLAIALSPEDVYAIVSTIRVSLAPEIFEAHIKQSGSAAAQLQRPTTISSTKTHRRPTRSR